jgi:hypothetical protein
MLQERPLNLGKRTGVIYDFPEVGDKLPLHVHGEDDIHLSIVARGRLKAFGPDGAWEMEASAGAVLDWEVGQWHGFIALEPNTRLVNIIKA